MPMQSVDLREAIRQALDEEMQRDPKVFVLGEEVGQYNGAYKITKGMLDKWGSENIRYSDFRTGLCRACNWSCHDRASSCCGVYEL